MSEVDLTGKIVKVTAFSSDKKFLVEEGTVSSILTEG